MMILNKSFLYPNKSLRSLEKGWKVKVSEKAKKVIFPIIKDLPKLFVPYLERISWYSKKEKMTNMDEGFLEKLLIFQEK